MATGVEWVKGGFLTVGGCGPSEWGWCGSSFRCQSDNRLVTTNPLLCPEVPAPVSEEARRQMILTREKMDDFRSQIRSKSADEEAAGLYLIEQKRLAADRAARAERERLAEIERLRMVEANRIASNQRAQEEAARINAANEAYRQQQSREAAERRAAELAAERLAAGGGVVPVDSGKTAAASGGAFPYLALLGIVITIFK